MSNGPSYRLDDLRRFGGSLGAAAGLPPARAVALASHLLWFDEAGLGASGLATLPDLLERIGRGEIDPKAEARIVSEHAAAVSLDGAKVVPPLALIRAAGLAIEKARDVGVGLVRVRGLGPAGPAAPVVAGMAIGPDLGLAIGPGPTWALGLPAEGGLPLVYDSALAGAAAPPPEAVAPWWVLAPEGGWLLVAVAASATEPLPSFQARVTAATAGQGGAAGRLLPAEWDARRRTAREEGVTLAESARTRLRDHARQLGVEPLD